MRDRLHDHRLNGPSMGMGCLDCPLLKQCGGYRRVGGGWSCQEGCKNCNPLTCDRVCLHNRRFSVDYREVNGFDTNNIGPLFPSQFAEQLPAYIPVISNGTSRTRPIETPWVAIKLSSLFRNKISNPTIRFESPDHLREHFLVPANAKIMVSGIDPDRQIEAYWHWRLFNDIPRALSKLGVSLTIAPNYSFILNDPRTQHLFNTKRILIAAEELFAQGIPSVPCLQAVCEADYVAWEDFLARHPEIHLVCVEFQTGLRNSRLAAKAISRIAQIQQVLGRPLHLIAVGGDRHLPEIRAAFDHWSIVDSSPFIRAHKRILMRTNSEGKTTLATAKHMSVDDLLQSNFEAKDIRTQRFRVRHRLT